jgi:hypothetical protein
MGFSSSAAGSQIHGVVVIVYGSGRCIPHDVTEETIPVSRDTREETVKPDDIPQRQLTPEAQRALAEAEERRRQREADQDARPKEVGGRDGPDPVRYGDWEKGGIASDF